MGIKKLFELAKEEPKIFNKSLLTLKSVSELYILSISRYVRNIKSIDNIKKILLELG